MNKLTSLFLIASTLSCTNKNASEQSLSKVEEIRYEQYFVQGQELYNKHCSNCHQENGEGLGKLFPPIKSSDYMTQNFEEVICLIKNGTSESIVVNGVSYNQPMPGVAELTNLEVAEVATFIYNTWGNDRGYIEVKKVNGILEKCGQTQE